MTDPHFEASDSSGSRWMGPFSPARGSKTGFRIHGGRLGTWHSNDEEQSFWFIRSNAAIRAIEQRVLSEWGGGRVLFLPSGLVIKPLPGPEEAGLRIYLGRFTGRIMLEPPDGKTFDLSNPGALEPGAAWPGPTTIGLECVMGIDGSLECTWYHPTATGREEVRASLRGPDPRLALGFQRARPGDGSGRVRITANGHVITNRRQHDGSWSCRYVGFVPATDWSGWERWIEVDRRMERERKR